MAKKRRPLRHGDKPPDGSTNITTMNASDATDPGKTTTRPLKGVRKSQAKHADDYVTPPQPGAKPSLADDFHALPSELRAEVFSHLIVQPVKWDIEHRQDCLRRLSDYDRTPVTCDISCSDGAHWAQWRQRQNDGLKAQISPWRSKWAPEQANSFLCTDCYHEKGLRPGPHPRPTSLPCLCARRQNLEVFLVCKKWYEEVAMVFYTRSIFAFEDGFSFVTFVKNMNPRWRQVMSHVSIMAVSFDIWPDDVVTWIRDPYGSYDDRLRITVKKDSIWARLRELPSLTYLELDHCFLTRSRTVKSMQRMGLRDVKQVRFTQCLAADKHPEWEEGTPTVWPVFAGRTLLVGGFVEEMARTIKGQRQKKLKKRLKLEEAMLDFRIEIGEATRTEEWWEV